ncbi:DNA polymerase I [Rubrimonas cliftonensis]|uniref:DNA polymerase I n=1 Tax=Rubrimonas cliftonensis TaxID=89524 RepID=A0A1H3ZJG3_9RHOB|nr:DNA polymerase I [Rubrimonas cliftonensis]SEA23748.1 DNA polymerase I [Rubrimonas cliftonensis]
MDGDSGEGAGESVGGIGAGDLLHLVDGSAYIFRAFHALPPLTRKSDGLPVGAVSGFCNMLFKLIQGDGGRAPTHLAVIFDHSSKTFRNDIYPDYKGHRPDPPEELVPQFPLIRDATRAFNCACIETPGFEADDIIATYARQAAAKGAEVVIVSADKDLMQLVGGRIFMRKPGLRGEPDETIDAEGVHEKFGVGPDKVVDVQALAGDATDNVPGAPGIGIKTAAQLINDFGDVEALLARAEEIKQPKRRQTLIDHAEQIRISRRLVELCDAVPDLPDWPELTVRAPEAGALIGFLKAMEFRTLTNRIAETLGAEAGEIAASDVAAEAPAKPAADSAAPAGEKPAAPIDHSAYVVIRDADTLRAWVAEATAAGVVAVDTETTSLDEMQAELVGVSLATAPGRAAYAPLGHVEGDGDLLGASQRAPGQMGLEEALDILRPMLADPAVLKIGQNLKYDMKVLKRHGVEVTPIDDTMLISYAQSAGLHSHGMDALSQRYLDHEPIAIKTLLGSGKGQITFDRVPIDKAAPYAAEDADVTLRLWKVLRPRMIAAGVTTVYETLERPLAPVLAAMELRGVKVDRDALSRLSNAFAQRMAGLEAEIHELAGEKFNVGSPKQLGEILFERLSLQGGRQSAKSGAYVTDADTLESLAAQGHDLPARVLDWRQLSKLKGTYTDALQGHINAETGRVHTSFSMAATTTGRLASTDPNLQNIPVRSEEGRRIREAFIAEPGNVLLSLDYSQIELRILACVADIPELKQAFREGVDIHALTASEMFGVPLEGMDPMVRRQAKAINFGVIYGISAFGLSNNLRIPQGEAKAFIDRYFERFPGIRAYMDATRDRAKRDGYVETLFGRRIHTPEINAKGPRASFAYRAAINAPIQGAAADVIRRAMARIPQALERAGSGARMLLQVHDELLFECPEDEADEAAALLRDVMENAAAPAAALDVPLTVEAGKGATWAAAH